MNDSTHDLPAGELFRHAEFLKRLARGLLRDEQLAEDVAQDAFVLALERPPRAGGALSVWLARVVRNLALNRQQGERRRAAREELAARAERDDTDQQAAERLELQRFVAERVARLDEAKRTAIYLRYYEGLEPQAIGARLGVPVKTVKTRLARGLAELRSSLDARARRSERVGRGARAAGGGGRGGRGGDGDGSARRDAHEEDGRGGGAGARGGGVVATRTRGADGAGRARAERGGARAGASAGAHVAERR